MQGKINQKKKKNGASCPIVSTIHKKSAFKIFTWDWTPISGPDVECSTFFFFVIEEFNYNIYQILQAAPKIIWCLFKFWVADLSVKFSAAARNIRKMWDGQTYLQNTHLIFFTKLNWVCHNAKIYRFPNRDRTLFFLIVPLQSLDIITVSMDKQIHSIYLNVIFIFFFSVLEEFICFEWRSDNFR